MSSALPVETRPELEAMRIALAEQIASIERQIEALTSNLDSLRRLKVDPQLEQLALQLVGALRTLPLEERLVDLFSIHGPAMRWTDAAEHLIGDGLPALPHQVLEALRASPRFHESHRGWYQLVSDNVGVAQRRNAKHRTVKASAYRLRHAAPRVEVTPA